MKEIVNASEDAGNPYMEESDELLTLNTKVIMSKAWNNVIITFLKGQRVTKIKVITN